MFFVGISIKFKDDSGNLLRRLRKGEKRSFEIIYNHYYSRLHRFALEYLPSPDDADDIVQNVFTKLWLYRDSLAEETNLNSWLYTVTRNEALSFLEHAMIVNRHRQSEEQRLVNINYYALREMKLSANTCFDIEHILNETLGKLPPQCRRVFECSRFRMMSNREIADYLSISVKTVETHITRSLKMLKTALADYL